jgi:hypothetical protein
MEFNELQNSNSSVLLNPIYGIIIKCKFLFFIAVPFIGRIAGALALGFSQTSSVLFRQ